MGVAVEIGSRIGPYRIERELGRGGMGHVFLCEHLSLGRKAALKVLAPTLAGDAAFRDRFVRESQLVAAIEHPNMIPIYDAGEVEALLFIAMRYVDGCDLKDLLAREHRLDVARALEIVGQAAAALDAAHARDIVHRDVKPANILLDEPTGRIFLTDFGIAGEAQRQGDNEGLVVGTLHYAAPEQIQGKPTGVPADVYALGGVLYETLTGERPYPKETDIAIIYAHLRDPPPRVTDKRDDLPTALDTVVAVALAKDEADRYPSCGDLIAAVHAAVQRVVPTARALERSPVEQLEAKPRRLRVGTTPPQPAGPLVGREQELAAAADALRRDGVSLVTLTGPGGTGKTRLALEVASALETDFPEGAICFAALASINDPALVLPAVAVALGIEERVRDADDRAPDADAVLEAVRNQLAGDRVLLVLDNFEHLLPAAAVVNDLLAAAPGLKVLATSRSLLRVRGEHEIPVHPFELPVTDGPIDLDTIAAAPAVALFVASAAGVRPGFALTDENASAVAEICRRLDGLPLAIELAAARMRLLSPQAVALRLDNRLELLTGGARDVHSRHQTLRGTIDWSYELLDPAAQTTLARVAVFIGGFSLEAAERVCAAEELERDAIVGALLSLADENLLRRREGTDGEVRFELLETIREYALFRLIERREVEEFRRRHAAFCVELAETAEPNLVGPKQAAWVSLLDDDSGNMRAALAWSLDGGTLEPGLRIAGALFRYWSIRGQLSEARRWLDQALGTSPDVSPEVLADALFAAAYTALGQGDFREAFERFEQSLEISRSRADAARSAKCLTQLAWLLTVRGELDDGTTLAEASLELARELGDDRTASLALSVLGDAAYASEEYERAAAFYADALALRRELGDVRIVADSLLKAGRTDLLLGNRPSAIALLEEGLAAAKELGDGWTTSVALAGLAFAALDARDADRAASLLGEALAFAGQRGDKRVAAECLTAAGATVALRGDETGAIQLAAAAECLRESISAAVSPLERRVVEMHVDRETTDLDSVEAAARAGRRLDFAAAIAFAVDRIRPAPGSP